MIDAYQRSRIIRSAALDSVCAEPYPPELGALHGRRLMEDRTGTAGETAARPAPQMLLGRLTPAERRLLHLVRQGCSNKEIAVHLNKSIRTVKTQLTSIYRKCEVRGRTRLLVLMR